MKIDRDAKKFNILNRFTLNLVLHLSQIAVDYGLEEEIKNVHGKYQAVLDQMDDIDQEPVTRESGD